MRSPARHIPGELGVARLRGSDTATRSLAQAGFDESFRRGLAGFKRPRRYSDRRKQSATRGPASAYRPRRPPRLPVEGPGAPPVHRRCEALHRKAVMVCFFPGRRFRIVLVRPEPRGCCRRDHHGNFTRSTSVRKVDRLEARTERCAPASRREGGLRRRQPRTGNRGHTANTDC